MEESQSHWAEAVERLRLDYPLWATRRVPIEQQQRRQRPLRLDQIGQCISVQDSEKRLNRIVQHAAQEIQRVAVGSVKQRDELAPLH